MSFGQAIKSGFNNYANFNGRASRSAFWWFYLFIVLVALALSIIEQGLGLTYGAQVIDVGGTAFESPGTGILTSLWALAVFLPFLGLAVRRLHDTDRTGWWVLWGFLLTFVCFVGLIILIVFYASKGTPGENRFGPPPLADII
jgi:uncharacterized membrane protein YhaH (DUF805 family)